MRSVSPAAGESRETARCEMAQQVELEQAVLELLAPVLTVYSEPFAVPMCSSQSVRSLFLSPR
jgi:hypothetical protein